MKNSLAASALIASFALAIFSIAGVSPAPQSTNLGLGEREVGSATFSEPGDAHGAVRRTFVVEKVNNQFKITKRSDKSVTLISDTAFWPPSFAPGNFTPLDDGWVLYDPYGPGGRCG
jgi:hypothetical protein